MLNEEYYQVETRSVVEGIGIAAEIQTFEWREMYARVTEEYAGNLV